MPKKLLFAEEYCIDLNATQAAIRAGFSAHSAQVQSSKMLLDPMVKARVAEIMEARAGKIEITQERVLQEFATAAFIDPSLMFGPNGQLLPIHDIPPHVRRAISSIEVEEIFEGTGENRIWIGYLKKVKLVSKEGTLNSTARHLGMFNDKLTVTVEDKRVAKLQAAQERAKKVRGAK